MCFLAWSRQRPCTVHCIASGVSPATGGAVESACAYSNTKRQFLPTQVKGQGVPFACRDSRVTPISHVPSDRPNVAVSASAQGKLAAFRGELMKQLDEYTSYNAEGHRVMQLKLQSLVLDLIHNIDIVDQLVAERATGVADWTWHRQLR